MISFFQRYVFHNFSLKILSLLLATGMWFLISRDDQPAEVAISAPILFQHVPASMEISTEKIPEAQIRVRGPERVIRQLRVNEVQAEIDLANVHSGERTFDLTPQQVRHPRDLTIVQVVPSQLPIALDRRLSRQVQVHPRVIGNFADGDQIVRVDADPATVTITGPRHHVEQIDAAITDAIDASGTRGSAVFTTNTYVTDPLVHVDGPASVRVTVTVQNPQTSVPH